MNFQLHKTATLFALLFTTTFAWTQTSIVDIKKVKTVSGLVEILKGNEADSSCTLKGFKLIVYPSQGDIFMVDSKGKKAPSDLKKVVDNLKSDDILVFSNVLIQCGNSKIATLVNDKKMVIK
jgi:hypothetical protein